MKDGFPEPAQVNLLQYVDPLLYGKNDGCRLLFRVGKSL